MQFDSQSCKTFLDYYWTYVEMKVTFIRYTDITVHFKFVFVHNWVLKTLGTDNECLSHYWRLPQHQGFIMYVILRIWLWEKGMRIRFWTTSIYLVCPTWYVEAGWNVCFSGWFVRMAIRVERKAGSWPITCADLAKVTGYSRYMCWLVKVMKVGWSCCLVGLLNGTSLW